MFRAGHLKTDIRGGITIVSDLQDQERIANGWLASEQGDNTQKTQEQLDYEFVQANRNSINV
jgi:hypothetical protein